jgi:small-conductance mechanosensitive channel/CRP-like cAMP-binding protein
MLNHLPYTQTYALAVAGGVLVLGFVVTHVGFRRSSIGQFICQLATFLTFSAALVSGGVVPFRPTPVMALTATYVAISLFKVIWWLASAWLFTGFIRAGLVFRRQAVKTRFLQDLFAGFIYICAVLGIIAYVFDIPVSGLLAASGVIAIVLGLALQSTLGDVFSGVVLNVSKPYVPGDWLILEGDLEGRVVETNWRSTTLLTPDNDLSIVPNSIIARARLINASNPIGAHGITARIRVDPTGAPSTAVAVLETALLGCNQILRAPPASVAICSLDAMALECELQFFVALVEQGPNAQNEVYDRVFRHCAAAGIRLAPPANSPMTLPARNVPFNPLDAPRRLLERLPIFSSLTVEDRLTLAPKMVRMVYKPGDVLVADGALVAKLMILSSGVLVASKHEKGGEIEVLRLAPGDCFGQGGPRPSTTTNFKVSAVTRSVVYDIAQPDMMQLMTDRPAISAELEQLAQRREAAAKSRIKPILDGSAHTKTSAERLATRVKSLLSLS